MLRLVSLDLQSKQLGCNVHLVYSFSLQPLRCGLQTCGQYATQLLHLTSAFMMACAFFHKLAKQKENEQLQLTNVTVYVYGLTCFMLVLLYNTVNVCHDSCYYVCITYMLCSSYILYSHNPCYCDGYAHAPVSEMSALSYTLTLIIIIEKLS